MRSSGHAALLCLAIFTVHAVLVSADTPAVPTDLLRGRPAAWTDPRSRCPDLRQADPEDNPVAVVVFHVGSTGIPSQARIKTSSGSPELDNAALACVMKLRFLPATAAGEGGGIESWQQMAWRGVTHAPAAPAAPAALAAPAAPPGGASVAAPAAGVAAATLGAAAATLGAAAAGASAATAATAATARTAPAAIGSTNAEVRVCADAQGKLTQDPVISRSSGDAAFDAAALAIARSGSGHYRAGNTANGQPAAGCVLLSIRSPGP
jgi:TonB family protein